MDDTSLDDFLDSEDGKTDEEDTESESVESQATTVEPAAAVLQWSPDSGDCDVCGTAVDRRWHSGAGLVCAGCKEW